MRVGGEVIFPRVVGGGFEELPAVQPGGGEEEGRVQGRVGIAVDGESWEEEREERKEG